MRNAICIVLVAVLGGCRGSKTNPRVPGEIGAGSTLSHSPSDRNTEPEAYDTYSYTNFSLQLPSQFQRQPRKGYSDVFLFHLERKAELPVYFSFERRVPEKINLKKMTNFQIIDVIFQSSADYPGNYSDFRAGAGEGPFKDGISLKKENSRSTYYAARFRIVSREPINVPGTLASQLVYYEIEREHPGSFVYADGKDAPAPLMKTMSYAYVIDTGPWKYVFRVGPMSDKDTLNDITKGIRAFRETAEPATAADGEDAVAE